MALGQLARAATPQKLARYAWKVWRQARPAARKHNISVWRIIREQIILGLRTGLGPGEYFLFELDDPQKTWKEKLAFISDHDHKIRHQFTPERLVPDGGRREI